MPETRDWKGMNEMVARLLVERTGEDMQAWNKRIREKGFPDEKSLRAWLTEQGVTGYPQMYLVMEQFGYPDYLTASADELIEGQYADRPALRPIYEAIIGLLPALGEAAIQMRKTYVSLVTPRRTFARIQPTTRNRVDLALRLASQKPEGRLQRSSVHEQMKVQISFTAPEQVDDEVLGWLQKAYDENS
jgi:uncharacterized protein DUF5655